MVKSSQYLKGTLLVLALSLTLLLVKSWYIGDFGPELVLVPIAASLGFLLAKSVFFNEDQD